MIKSAIKVKLSKLFLVLVLLSSVKVHAQLSIEEMDAVGKLVSKLEAATTDSIYSDGKNKYKLSFPEESFAFNYENGRAWKAVYKENHGNVYLAMTENIDLGKVTGFTWDRSYTSRVLMHFPKGTIKTAISKNGGEIYMIDEDYLEFFFTDDMKMLLPLAEVCHALKAAQGKIAKSSIKKFEENFSALMDMEATDVDNMIIQYNDFLKKNEGSLYEPIVKEYLKGCKDVKQYRRESEIASQFRDSLCKAYFYKPDIFTPQEFIAYNPDVKSLLKPKNEETTGVYSAPTKIYFNPGPNTAMFTKVGLLYKYLLQDIEGEGEVVCRKYMNDRIKWLESKIPKSFIKVNDKEKSIHIIHPKGSACIGYGYSVLSKSVTESLWFRPGNGACSQQ